MRLSDVIAKAARAYLRDYRKAHPKPDPYNIATNGEAALLERLRVCKIATVFDVGANHGEYALACATRFPNAAIHCFEIVPETAAVLRRNIGEANIKVHPVGLSNVTGVCSVAVSSNDQLSSLIHGGKDIYDQVSWSERSAKTMRGDDFCEANGIESIDILKIDTEGAEHLVMAGFERMFTREAIKLVQFEYGMNTIYTRYFLRDHYAFLHERGFEIGKVLPKLVAFKDYAPRDEDLKGPNFVAVHSSCPIMRVAASGRESAHP